jgi:hypothetical protein
MLGEKVELYLPMAAFYRGTRYLRELTNGCLLKVSVDIRDEIDKQVHIVLLTLPHVIYCKK